MDVKIEEKSETKKEIVVSISIEEMEKYIDKAAHKLSHEMTIKGFRTGHIPRNIFENTIGKESLFEEVPGIKKTKRAEMPELPVNERIKTFEEADLVLQEEDALRESKRCLVCCRICYNKDVAA